MLRILKDNISVDALKTVYYGFSLDTCDAIKKQISPITKHK